MIKKIKIDHIVIAVLILFFILKLFLINYPSWQIFDEIYYYNWAHDYLINRNFFDVHPPLGKLFISLGEILFNNSLFGARFFQALAGSIIIYYLYIFAKLLFKNKAISIFVVILSIFETSLFIESRLALINIFIPLFLIPSAYHFWKFREKSEAKDFYLSLLFISLATAVKWTAIFAFPVYILFFFADNVVYKAFFKNLKEYKILFLIISFLSLIGPYFLTTLFDIQNGWNIVEWHVKSFNFHHTLKGNHPYASPWYKWFLDLRPIWLDYRQNSQSNVFGIIEIGNPFVVIGGTIALILSIPLIWITKNIKVAYLTLLVFFLTLPWVIISRESFYYHFIPILPFIIMILAYFLGLIYKTKVKFLVIIFLLFSIGFFIWYWPLLNGLEVPYKTYLERTKIHGWR